MTSTERRQQRLENFNKTMALLKKSCETKIEDERDMAGIVQFYEMAIELSWKCMRDYLVNEQYEDPVSPKACIKAALNHGVISSVQADLWSKGLNLRNLTSHTYDEKSIQTIIQEINNKYLSLLIDLNNIVQK